MQTTMDERVDFGLLVWRAPMTLGVGLLYTCDLLLIESCVFWVLFYVRFLPEIEFYFEVDFVLLVWRAPMTLGVGL
eukprot:SAG11_NODE_34239_length_273_cov_0.591954_1_plen_75_part_10